MLWFLEECTTEVRACGAITQRGEANGKVGRGRCNVFLQAIPALLAGGRMEQGVVVPQKGEREDQNEPSCTGNGETFRGT